MVARSLNYTIEGVLDHNIDWLNAMLKEIGRQEMVKYGGIKDLHGIDTEKKTPSPESDKMQLQSLGLKCTGRPSKTRVVR